MRIKKEIVVCDEGLHEAPRLHTVLLTVDGRARAWTLCDEHVQPWRDKLGDAPKDRRGRVLTQQELKAMRR